MEKKIKRPISVWITQIILILLTLTFLAVMGISVTNLLRSGAPLFGILIGAGLNLALIVLFLTAFWGMVRRKTYGRWLSVGSLLFILLISILGQIFRPSGPMEYYEYSNSTQRMAGIMMQIVLVVSFLTLTLHLGFAICVSAFFSSGKNAVIRAAEPSNSVEG